MYDYFDNPYWWEPFDENTVRTTLITLIISLISMTLGFAITSFFKKNDLVKKNEIIEESKFTLKLRKTSKLIFFITLIPTLYLILDKISYSLTYGYIDLYLSYQGGSIILERMKYINLISFYSFLATMPKKADTKWLILIYVFYNGLTVLEGARGTAVVSLLIIIFYFIFRNKYDSNKLNGETWISKKILGTLALMAPFAIMFLSFWGYYRVNENLNNIQLNDLFLMFFRDQGGSVDIISYAQEVTFPSTNINYTFGPVINFFKNNFISQLFNLFEVYDPHTPEMALYGNNMAHTITYIVRPHDYLKGIGMGSNYIAEILVDFGYIGLILFNTFLGALFYYINNFNGNKQWIFTLYLLMLNSLFLLPRSSALNWLMDIANVTTVGSLLIIYFIARIGKKRRRDYQEEL